VGIGAVTGLPALFRKSRERKAGKKIRASYYVWVTGSSEANAMGEIDERPGSERHIQHLQVPQTRESKGCGFQDSHWTMPEGSTG